MPRVKRPSVKTKCAAAPFAAPNERIVEFFDPNTRQGGLIAIRTIASDAGGPPQTTITLYRLDTRGRSILTTQDRESVTVSLPILSSHPY